MSGIRTFILFILILAIPAYGYCYDSHGELSMISAGTKGWKANNLFFLHVFEGEVPVPNRYQLNFDPESAQYALTFVSPNGNLINEGSEQWPFGTIVMGSEDLLPKNRSIRSGKPTQEFSCFGISIEIRQAKLPGVHYVLWTRNHMYLAITDSNDGLWKAMLSAYGQSIGHEEPCSFGG